LSRQAGLLNNPPSGGILGAKDKRAKGKDNEKKGFFLFPSSPFIPFSVFGFRFSVKKIRIISKLKLKFVAFETELGIIPLSFYLFVLFPLELRLL